jgi:hypothetical protein
VPLTKIKPPGNMVPRICAALSESLSGARRVVRNRSYLCERRQRSFHCGHLIFYKSYAAAGEGMKLLAAVLVVKR